MSDEMSGDRAAIRARHTRQPVVASNATSSSAPSNRARNFRTAIRSAGVIRAREISPVSVSIHSAEICARC